MKTFLKVKTTDGRTELFNFDRMLNITPYENGTAKILMGAGLYWDIYTDSIEIIDCTNDLIKAVKGEK